MSSDGNETVPIHTQRQTVWLRLLMGATAVSASWFSANWLDWPLWAGVSVALLAAGICLLQHRFAEVLKLPGAFVRIGICLGLIYAPILLNGGFELAYLSIIPGAVTFNAFVGSVPFSKQELIATAAIITTVFFLAIVLIAGRSWSHCAGAIVLIGLVALRILSAMSIMR